MCAARHSRERAACAGGSRYPVIDDHMRNQTIADLSSILNRSRQIKSVFARRSKMKANKLSKASILIGGLLFLALVFAAPAAFASPADATGNPNQSGVLVKNYWGQPMTFNIGDTEYTIPADGQLFIVLPPGDYTFSANVEGDDTATRTGEVVLTNSEKLDLSFAAA